MDHKQSLIDPGMIDPYEAKITKSTVSLIRTEVPRFLRKIERTSDEKVRRWLQETNFHKMDDLRLEAIKQLNLARG